MTLGLSDDVVVALMVLITIWVGVMAMMGVKAAMVLMAVMVVHDMPLPLLSLPLLSLPLLRIVQIDDEPPLSSAPFSLNSARNTNIIDHCYLIGFVIAAN